MNIRLLVLLQLIVVSSVSAQSESSFFYAKADIAGVFLKLLGPTLSNEEITSFEVKRWALPAIDVGYQFSAKVAAGVNITPAFNISIEEHWGLSYAPLDGALKLQYNTPFIISLYTKYYPFAKGLYASAALQYLDQTNYNMHLSPLMDELIIGEQSYASAAIGKWNYKSALTAAFQLGYTWQVKLKYLIDLGIQVPIINAPFHENIQLSLVDGTMVAPSDLLIAQKRVEEETFYYPVQFRIQFGRVF